MPSTHAPKQRDLLAVLPSQQDVAFYHQHGYWISPPIIPNEVLDAAERGMDRFYAGDYDPAVARPTAVQPGGRARNGWQHHCRTVHGSGPNRGSQPRRSLAIHLQPGDNRWSGNLRPDGQPERHTNDRLVDTVDGVPDYADARVCPRLWPVDS